MAAPEHILPEPSGFPWTVDTTSESGTEELGFQFGSLLRGGDVALLYGPLGTGKTCFTRGLCRALGVTEGVISPTFTLVNTYAGTLTIHHLDFYRIDTGMSLEDIGVPEILDDVDDGRAVLVAEWADPLVSELKGIPRIFSWLGQMGSDPLQRTWLLKVGAPNLDSVPMALGMRKVGD